MTFFSSINIVSNLYQVFVMVCYPINLRQYYYMVNKKAICVLRINYMVRSTIHIFGTTIRL